MAAADYKEDQDPTKFKSEKCIGPLPALINSNWKAEVQPVMTCYKLVTIEFKFFGLQSRVENYFSTMFRRRFLNFHRQVFCSIDKWHGMTMEDIRTLEDKTKEELEKQRSLGEIRGTKPI